MPDGVRESPQRSADNEPPPNPKSVSFIPLSPMSSRTMEAHRRSHIAHADSGDTVARDSLAGDRDRRGDNNHLRCMQRGSSDPSADRSVARHPASDSDEEVEILPNRFDSQGRPLDPLSARQGLHGRWTTRSGQFERRPRRPGDWDISGSWQVGGTDPEAVERMVRGVTGALDGRRGWMGVLGDVLNSGLLGGGPEERQGPQDDDGGRGRHRR